MTFEELLPSASQSPPFSNPVVATQGYQFTSAGNCCNYVNTVGQGTVANGEQSLEYIDYVTTMTALDGSAFSVSSLDTKDGPYLTGVHSIALTGTRANGSQILQTLGVGDAYQTYGLSGFTNLISLQFAPIASGGYTRIDNIAVVALAGAVPEPASWAMMLAGFGLVGGAMRRRRGVIISRV